MRQQENHIMGNFAGKFGLKINSHISVYIVVHTYSTTMVICNCYLTVTERVIKSDGIIYLFCISPVHKCRSVLTNKH